MFNIVLIVNIELEQTSVQSLDWKIQNAMHYTYIHWVIKETRLS